VVVVKVMVLVVVLVVTMHLPKKKIESLTEENPERKPMKLRDEKKVPS
jgi:hypothetical protein